MNFGDYVGIPFLDGGDTREGCDCWGLIRLIYDERFSIDLPEYNDVSAHDLRRVSREMLAGSNDATWREVTSPRAFDVVLMRVFSGALIAHVGVVVSEAQFLHVEKATDAAVVPFDHSMYRDRIVGFRRHRDFA